MTTKCSKMLKQQKKLNQSFSIKLFVARIKLFFLTVMAGIIFECTYVGI